MQTIRERHGLKVVIGGKWEDPTIDNPILRRLPLGWELASEDPPRQPLSGDHWVIVTIIFGAAVLVTQMVLELLGWWVWR